MKKYASRWAMVGLMLVAGSSFLLSGCGGGGGSVDGAASSTDGTITGTAVKGPVSGATVQAFAIHNGSMGPQIGTGITDTQGNFTMSIGSHSGPVMLRVSGGSYIDEATGISVAMGSHDVMTSLMPYSAAGAVTGGVHITPLTSMAQAMAEAMSGGMIPSNIETANAAIGNYFAIADILHTHPMNPLIPGSGSASTQDMRHYGLVLAAMAEYARSMGMPFSSEIVTAMMDDAADGVMNGRMGNTQVTIGGRGGRMGHGPFPANGGTSDLANAMAAFMGSAMNRSGLTIADMQSLHDRMAASNGWFR